MTSHARRHHRARGSTGHVWQGRFKAFPIQEGGYLLAVLRYVERNPLRAGLVARAEDRPWSSLHAAPPGGLFPALDPGPVPRPAGWAAYVNAPQTEAELAALRRAGHALWGGRLGAAHGRAARPGPRGRPVKATAPAAPALFGEDQRPPTKLL